MSFISKQLDFVRFIMKTGVLKIDNFKQKKYVDMKKRYWQAIHKHAQDLGLSNSKDFVKTRVKIWNQMKKQAQESLMLLRRKEINKLTELDRTILMALGLTETEIRALEDEPTYSNDMAIVKRERSLNTEVILSDDDTRCDEWHERIEQRKLQKKCLQGKILINRLKAYKLIKELNLPLDREILTTEDLEL